MAAARQAAYSRRGSSPPSSPSPPAARSGRARRRARASAPRSRAAPHAGRSSRAHAAPCDRSRGGTRAMISIASSDAGSVRIGRDHRAQRARREVGHAAPCIERAEALTRGIPAATRRRACRRRGSCAERTSPRSCAGNAAPGLLRDHAAHAVPEQHRALRVRCASSRRSSERASHARVYGSIASLSP